MPMPHAPPLTRRVAGRASKTPSLRIAQARNLHHTLSLFHLFSQQRGPRAEQRRFNIDWIWVGQVWSVLCIVPRARELPYFLCSAWGIRRHGICTLENKRWLITLRNSRWRDGAVSLNCRGTEGSRHSVATMQVPKVIRHPPALILSYVRYPETTPKCAMTADGKMEKYPTRFLLPTANEHGSVVPNI